MSRRLANMNNYDLIENIKQRPALWNKTIWKKTDLGMREELWNDLAVKMGQSRSVVKNRWKNLRDSYRKLLKKAETSDVNSGKWTYFDAMDFMREISLTTKSRSSDITAVKRPEVCSLEADYSMDLNSLSDDESTTDPLSLPNRDIKAEQMEHIIKEVAPEIQFETPRLGNSPPQNPNDDDFQFLMSLHPHFKQVPLNRKLPLRMKIEQIIYEELYSTNNDCNN